MNFKQIELYQRIQAFSFDRIDVQLPFSKRLAKENGWSSQYTQRVIEEYKKFVFLAVVAEHPVSPSDAVDQVWHLHLTYTKSYWQDFCSTILQTPLHHEPTLGGAAEQNKFSDLYHQTLESYKYFFDEFPATDIWPNSKKRFGRDLHFRRINTQQNWVIPKLDLNLIKVRLNQVVLFLLLFLLSFAVISGQASASLPNPINLTGADFLKFYIISGIIGLILASWLRYSLSLPDGTPNQQTENLNLYEIAFLAGDSNQVIRTAITSLVQQGYAEIETKHQFFWINQRKLIVKKMVTSSCHPIEQAVAQEIIATDGRIEQILHKTKSATNMVREHLQRLGLVMSAEQSFKAQVYPSLIIVFLLGLGIIKMLVGISRDKPIGFLIFCLFVLANIGWRFFTKPYRSRYGDRVLKNLVDRFKPLKTANRDDEQLLLSFAVLGSTILAANPAFAELTQMFISIGGDGGGDVGGDGGGCGGGCGGCGG